MTQRFERTGEYRVPVSGEYYESHHKSRAPVLCVTPQPESPRWILRPIPAEPEEEPKVRYYRYSWWEKAAFVALRDGEGSTLTTYRDRSVDDPPWSRAELERNVANGSMVVLSESDALALLDPVKESEPKSRYFWHPIWREPCGYYRLNPDGQLFAVTSSKEVVITGGEHPDLAILKSGTVPPGWEEIDAAKAATLLAPPKDSEPSEVEKLVQQLEESGVAIEGLCQKIDDRDEEIERLREENEELEDRLAQATKLIADCRAHISSIRISLSTAGLILEPSPEPAQPGDDYVPRDF